jgi:hypothetical protein
LFELPAHFLVFHEISALGSGEADIDRFDEVPVIFQIAAQNLRSKFVGKRPRWAAICASCASFSS